MQYAIIIEKSDAGFGAFVPDLPGCVAVGETEDEVRQLIREAIELHIDGLRESGGGASRSPERCRPARNLR